jgi:NTP pyrophosphatase (non-canonical NTP hydrolase)
MGEGMTESERGSEQRAGGRGIAEFQRLIEAIYFEKDAGRGMQGTLLWFVEEVGELVRALRRGERDNLEEEFGDVFAWLVSLASISEVDLEQVAFDKYGEGCPRCQATPCTCG